MHTNTIKILMCKNKQKQELGLSLSYEKRELRSRSHTHENQELRSWSNVRKKSSGIGTVTFLRRLRSPEIIHTVAEHIDDPE